MTAIQPPPINIDPELFKHLSQMHAAVLKLQQSPIPPRPVANFTVLAGPGSNLIRFTRSDANTYALYINTTPTLNGATRVDLGLSNNYTDNVGKAAVTRYYWITSKLGQLEGTPVGPKVGTTLALNAPITLTPAPAGSETPAVSDETGSVVPGRPLASGYQEDL